ncbi:MAG: ABC transporter permease [Bacteroidales bacterium]|nr:MAG: ABC transporter permease [Bacteroidales bacterium]
MNNSKPNKFWGFALKEFRHIFRDKRTLLIIFGMPIAELLIFGYVVTNEIKDANIAILDKSGDYLSQKLTSKLASSGYFIPTTYLYSENEIEPVLRSGKAKMVVVYEPNFAEKFFREKNAAIQIITDASEPNTASLLANYAGSIINSFASENGANELRSSPIDIRVRMLYNSELKSVFMFVPGTMALILMLLTAMMTAISIAREKELGTMEVLLVSPLKPSHIVLGKVLPYVGLAFINALVILFLGYTVFDLPMRGSLALLLLVSFVFIILALSLGIFISTVSKTQQVAMFFSMIGLMLPTMLLSGFIFPIENMPLVLQWLSALMPPRWFISAIKTIMIKGEGIAYVWKEMLIMIGMIVFFLTLSIKKFKVRLS